MPHACCWRHTLPQAGLLPKQPASHTHPATHLRQLEGQARKAHRLLIPPVRLRGGGPAGSQQRHRSSGAGAAHRAVLVGAAGGRAGRGWGRKHSRQSHRHALHAREAA